jgi:hypothetical protein
VADSEAGVNLRRVEQLVSNLAAAHPLAFKAVYPRNTVVPKGYTDPRLYSCVLLGNLRVVQYVAMQELAHRTAYCMSLSLIANRVPTYFVADEFAQAVANTDLPGDFKFAELKWPMDAQLFVLSEQFCQAYYGHTGAPFLSIARMKTGTYPQDFARVPPLDTPTPSIDLTMDRIVMDYDFFGAEIPVTYNGSYPMKDGIEIFKTAPWNDATIMESAYHGMDLEPKGALTKEQEDQFVLKAQKLAIKLLLTVSELPAMVEHGKVTRHAIVTQQGKVKLPQLYSANVIGRTYRIPRKYAAVSTGSRAKPRFKYRRGHWTWQAKRFKNVEFVAVDQMPRKPEGFIDFDAAGEELSGKFRSCHERQWIEGFFFEDEEDTAKPGQSSLGANPPEST